MKWRIERPRNANQINRMRIILFREGSIAIRNQWFIANWDFIVELAAVALRFHLKMRKGAAHDEKQIKKFAEKKSSFRFRISWDNSEIKLNFLKQQQRKKQEKNCKWNSKLITKWRQLVYFGLANGARIVVVVDVAVRLHRYGCVCVSFNLFHIFLFLRVGGKWIACLPFYWHYYSILYGLCAIVLYLLWIDACAQITATGCSQVSCVVIVHCVTNEKKNELTSTCDDLKFISELTAADWPKLSFGYNRLMCVRC